MYLISHFIWLLGQNVYLMDLFIVYNSYCLIKVYVFIVLCLANIQFIHIQVLVYFPSSFSLSIIYVLLFIYLLCSFWFIRFMLCVYAFLLVIIHNSIMI